MFLLRYGIRLFLHYSVPITLGILAYSEFREHSSGSEFAVAKTEASRDAADSETIAIARSGQPDTDRPTDATDPPAAEAAQSVASSSEAEPVQSSDSHLTTKKDPARSAELSEVSTPITTAVSPIVAERTESPIAPKSANPDVSQPTGPSSAPADDHIGATSHIAQSEAAPISISNRDTAVVGLEKTVAENSTASVGSGSVAATSSLSASTSAESSIDESTKPSGTSSATHIADSVLKEDPAPVNSTADSGQVGHPNFASNEPEKPISGGVDPDSTTVVQNMNEEPARTEPGSLKPEVRAIAAEVPVNRAAADQVSAPVIAQPHQKKEAQSEMAAVSGKSSSQVKDERKMADHRVASNGSGEAVEIDRKPMPNTTVIESGFVIAGVGDTWNRIAERIYGDSTMAEAIWKENLDAHGRSIDSPPEVGRMVRLPGNVVPFSSSKPRTHLARKSQ